jgi:hypothetical protein
MNELKPNFQRAQWAAYCLFAHVVVLFVFSYLSLKLATSAPEQLFNEERRGTLYSLYVIFSILNLATFVATVITFVMWFRRSYFNLHKSYEVVLLFPEQWAAVSWFVPFINFYRPYVIAKEIWNKYQQIAPSPTSKSTAIVAFWWFSWIFYNLVNYCCSVIFGMGAALNTAESEQVFAFCGFMNIVPGVLLLHYIKQVSTWEQRYYLANSERDIIEHFDAQE